MNGDMVTNKKVEIIRQFILKYKTKDDFFFVGR